MLENDQLEEYLDFLRFGSISTDSEYKDQVETCGAWLVDKLSTLGLDAKLHQTKGCPIVVGSNKHQENRKTVLIYGHYDVQPVDPIDAWDHPPFEPHVDGHMVYARGASDNKGQIFSHILGVQKIIEKNGEVPVNIIFLIEGEEEIGSPNLEPFLEEHKDELACDVILVSDTDMVAPGVPTLAYGLRGVAALEVTLKGPKHDLHSGIYGGGVMNPLTALARLVASLHDEKMKVSVDGFYNDVLDLFPWEKEAWEKLPITDQDWLDHTGVPKLEGERECTTLERLWSRPTVEVNGLWGGYQGEGTKTVIPSEANAKLTFRTVPNQTADQVLDCVEKHLRKHCPESVTIEIERGHSGEGYLCNPQSSYGKAAQKALRKAFNGKDPALVREGGSIPIIAGFQRILGVDTLLLGLALPDCRAHSPNENFDLRNMEYGIHLSGLLLREIANL
ncbi:MAG: dipeptidase [Verrucomicrobiota bacterium]